MKKPYINKETKTLLLNRTINNKFLLTVNKSLKDKETNIYMTAVSEEDCKEIVSYLKASKEKRKELVKKYSHIVLSNLLMQGNANKRYSSYVSYSSLLDKIIKKEKNYLRTSDKRLIETIFYRNYQRRQEDWENDICHINACPDVKMSWQSAIRALGAEKVHGINNDFIPFYVILWYDTLELKEINKYRNL